MNFTYEENVSLAPYCSMKAGGKAKYFVLPKSEQELVSALRFFRERGDKHIVVGNCSNLLFGDGGYEGAVIYAAGIRGASCENGVITAYCGETLSALARVACEASVSGLEFCYGIPGTVGGAVYMNAGAYGGEISQTFIRGRFIDENNEIIVLTKEEMDFGYRKSRMNYENLVLVSAEFAGGVGDKVQIRARMDELMAKRKASQPLEYPSCGSAFKRPEGHYAGALIEQCGLKGKSIGGAQVSVKHAGFIINAGNATATDVISLLEFVSDTVYENTGVRLEPEIRVIK
ncbi:MAG: UDP-N-acetylmuramate dehydrogenase [Clostridia bacterium]|nr:UDP-N-acetylmuramate dehydrogenase [Clostridia bacterium]